MVPASRLPVAPLMTLPGRYYYDPAIFAAEQERIFSDSWLCVGRADALPEPGRYVLASVGQENVVVLRDKQGALRAFLNVCRHRGGRVCLAEQGQVRATLQCRYHAWTYGLDGALLGAPNMKEDPSFDAAAFGLWPVALALWEGLIFLHLGEAPDPLSVQLGAAYSRYAHYHIGTLRVAHHITYEVQANWKLLVENFSECCHCAIAHPELSAQVPSFKAGYVSSYSGQGAELGLGIESLTTSGKTARPLFPDLTAQDRHRYYGNVVRPNVFFSLHPDYVLVHYMEAKAPDRTIVHCDWLFEPSTIALPDFDPSDAVGMWDLVNRQDWEICEMTQLGMRSKVYRGGGFFAPQEYHIRDFNDYVLARLGHSAGDE